MCLIQPSVFHFFSWGSHWNCLNQTLHLTVTHWGVKNSDGPKRWFSGRAVLPPLGNSWNHFWLSQLGMLWHPVGRGQGCGQTHYNAQDSPSHKDYAPEMSTLLRGRKPGWKVPSTGKAASVFQGKCLSVSWQLTCPHLLCSWCTIGPGWGSSRPGTWWGLENTLGTHRAHPAPSRLAARTGLCRTRWVGRKAGSTGSCLELTEAQTGNPPAVASKFGWIKE